MNIKVDQNIEEKNMLHKIKLLLKKVLPNPVINLLRCLTNGQDLIEVIAFLQDNKLNASIQDRLKIIKQLYVISSNIDSPHTQKEIITFIKAILSLIPNSDGVIVEAGCYKGSSTAKFSLAAKVVGKELVVFDSFQGIPKNTEPHDKNIFGGSAGFKPGDYCGALEEVKANVTRFGKIESCRFIKGWFDDTMSKFKEPISAIYLDVDLASSTRTCLKYLYPLLKTDGVLFSQDGHLPLVINVFNDDKFWLNEVGYKKPNVIGLGKRKLIKIIKEF